jgi:hypothetical protein
MSWGDYYRRRDAIDEVLAAGTHLPDVVPDAFDNREELALALQYKWSLQLTGRIAVALADARHVDRMQAVAAAWRTTARHNPALRALLDDYTGDAGPDFRETQRVEQRMLAQAAGLADAGETSDLRHATPLAVPTDQKCTGARGYRGVVVGHGHLVRKGHSRPVR